MKKFKKTLKVTGISLGSLLVLMIALPFLFPQAINRKINEWANGNINGHISFSRTRLSFFKHFPNLTLSLYDVTLMGSAPFEHDTLIAAQDIALGIDVPSIFRSKITINKIFLKGAFFNIHVDSAGHANYNIYKSAATATATTDTSGGASLGINKILVENSRLVYNDESMPMLIKAAGFNYLGTGDLSKDIFDLKSHTNIQSLDFYYNHQPYVIGKKVNADLVTQINTRSLAFEFQQNSLMINELPVEFNGRFGFIKDGYDMNFNINSHENDIAVIVSALPASVQKQLDDITLNGTGAISITLAGKYVVKDSLSPDLSASVKIRNGYVAYNKCPSPVTNLYLDLNAKMPHLNADSLALDVDSLHLNVADGYLNSVLHVKGQKEPEIYARANAEIDLEKWQSALGVKPFQVRGKYTLHLLAQGKYATATVNNKGRVDTVITSIPKFSLRSSLKGGYFKYTSLPQAISNISFDMDAACPDSNYKHITANIDNIEISALKSYIKGSFHLLDIASYNVDAALRASIQLDDIKKCYPIDSLDMHGNLTATIKAKGSYQPEKKKYPQLNATIAMQDGYVQTKYYPHPIQHLQLSTTVTDNTGDLAGLSVSIQPLSFSFENKTFEAKADLKNFNDLAYNISLNGTLDLGRIYQVFAIKGYNVTGSVDARLKMKGRQSDATAGRYSKLYNKGSLTVNDITLTTDLYPHPFYITKGVFSFKQDKMQLDTFTAKYAHSLFVLNGALSNVIDYIMKPGSILTGTFNLQSDQLVVDDFMAATTTTTVAPTPAAPVTTVNAAPGVVMVPKNLNLTFDANVKKVQYTDIVLKDAKGHMAIKDGVITLKETGFNIIGAPVTMDADYTSVTPQKAKFNYHIVANDFDVHKAYTGIKMFRDLATSASSAEGLISLDYKLGGVLLANMKPSYPSLKGGGVITADKIKMKGFKLFSAIGKETGKDSLGSNSDVSGVKIKSTIANNIITIERTKMRVSVFRARFGGQVSFNDELNLKFRLGLPPLGLIGIPMTITGTEDKPKIHMGKGKDEDELKETADADE